MGHQSFVYALPIPEPCSTNANVMPQYCEHEDSTLQTVTVRSKGQIGQIRRAVDQIDPDMNSQRQTFRILIV